MAYLFLPSAFQKRLLRYALSRLEVLDTDALDLENLDIAWGKRSTIELREVGLRLKKLTSLLHLPRSLELLKAKVILIRITVPADIHTSSISIEVEGVDVQVRLITGATSESPASSGTSFHDDKDERTTHQHGTSRPSKQSAIYDPGGLEASESDEEDGNADLLPTTADLAESFLQAEPPVERARLEAAIASQSRGRRASRADSEGDDEDEPTGTGTGLSLPGFLTEFLKGINERMQITVKGIVLNMETDLQPDTSAVDRMSLKSEMVTIQLRVDEIAVDKVSTSNVGVQPTSGGADTSNGPELPKMTADDYLRVGAFGTRRIDLRNIRLSLLSDPSVFANFLRSSTLSSPSTVQRSISSIFPSPQPDEETQSPPTDQPLNTSPKSPVSASPIQSGFPFASPQESDHEPTNVLEASVTANEEDEFADAPEGGKAETVRVPASAASPAQATYRVDDTASYMSPFGELSTPESEVHDVQGLIYKFGQTRITVPGELNSQEVHGGEEFQENPLLTRRGDDSLPEGEDLAESKIFSHEEAQSMYMSALTRRSSSESHVTTGSEDNKELYTEAAAPKAEEKENDSALGSHTTFQEAPRRRNLSAESSFRHSPQLGVSPKPANQPAPSAGSDHVTTHTEDDAVEAEAEIDMSSSNSKPLAHLSKQVLHVDGVTIWIPVSGMLDERMGDGGPGQHLSLALREPKISGPQEMSSSTYPAVPGAFISPAERGQSRGNSDPFTEPHINRPSIKLPSQHQHQSKEKERQRESADQGSAASTRVTVGHCLAQFDPALGKLIIALGQSIKGKLSNGSQLHRPSAKPSEVDSVSDIQVKVEMISLELLESLAGTSLAFEPSSSPITATFDTSSPYQPSDRDILLRATLKNLEIGRRSTGPTSTETTVSASKVVLGYAKDPIISFDAGLRMRESIRDVRLPADKDISVSARHSPSHAKASVETLPIHLDLDLQRLDETLAWFGGFSSILGLGSSMASLATVTAPTSPPTSSDRKRVVHFEAPHDGNRSATTSPAQNKVDIRMGGIIIDLHGKECDVHLDTTAVKIVGRQQGIGAQVDKIKVFGPNIRDDPSAAAVVVGLENLRLEYLSLPKEVDLSRLLCLLSPSNNKYDVEDDILLDTLLRQRRQGPVLRVTLEKLSGRSEGLAHLTQLSSLSEEIAKLSSVTKYLPDDDRAGILTLGLIRDINLEANINHDLGRLSLQSRNMEISYISLPLLLATSIASVRLYRNSVEELMGELSSLNSQETNTAPPMIMARMIGDEMEPTVKIKLRGVRFEYWVPLISELSKTANDEEEMGNQASFVAGLGQKQASQQTITAPRVGPGPDDKQNLYFKYAKVDIVFQDCALGLNPIGLPSKGLVMLSHMELSGGISSEDLLKLIVSIRKSSLLIIDDTNRITPGSLNDSRAGGEATRSEGSPVPDFCAMGFVSVAYISSVKITMQEHAVILDGRKSLDLELSDNLLVLESCADSTQTLQSLFNGLMTPRPPSQAHKYRTEVVPVQDMLASLSADAFGPIGLQENFETLPTTSEEDVARTLLVDEDYLSFIHEDAMEFGSSSQSVFEGASQDNIDEIEDISPGIDSRVLLDTSSTEHQQVEGEPLQVQEDYFGMASKVDTIAHKWDSVKNRYGVAADISGSPLRIRIRNVHIIWNLFDGYDWPKTRDTISQAVDDVTSRVKQRQARSEPAVAQDEDESVIGDFLFNSIYIGIPANRNPKELPNEINRDVDDLISETESDAFSSPVPSSQPAQQSKSKSKRLRLGRSKHHKMAIELKGITMDLIVFPPDSGETQSSIDVRVRDFEILDHVPTSTWRKFATYMQDAGIRESNANMLHLEILNVQPIPELAASEIVLKVTLLPLRLHVDQDALDFLTRFFEFKGDSSTATTSTSDVPFLQRVEVNSVRLKLDYKPKKIDYAGLRSGHTTEFMNFFILDQADMVLRHVIIYGVAGLDKLSRTLNDIWMPDIKRTQLPGVLAGLAPVRSLVNVGGGVRDLVVVPLKEYRKDGRIVRSIQKGALAFAKTTTSELVKLGAKVAIRTQTALQGAEDLFVRPSTGANTGWEDAALDEEEKKAISLYADQPVGVMQGLRGAYHSLERDLLTARDAIVAMPGEMLESGSAQGAAKAVLQRAPTIIFRPAIGATKAISQTLMGATNALDPDHRRRIDEKYKRH
ncbi:MAG: autophagy- protein 2 [Peltula sp. TS41687]|nr:MAG: autophagy- protein 2 [Peltula sp. TS41687]